MVDLETTGLDPAEDRIVEVAVVTTDAAGAAVEEWRSLVQPGRDPGPTEVHGLTAAALADAPRYDEVATELARRLRGTTVVAHNLAFDAAFLAAEQARRGPGGGTGPWEAPAPGLCTLELARRVLPGPDGYSLAACCEATGVRLDDAHTALGDARATAGLLAALLDRLGSGAWRPWPRRRLGPL